MIRLQREERRRSGRGSLLGRVWMLRLLEELVPYSTDDDLMAVFIGDECRALSRRSGDAEAIYFVLNIYSNPSSDPEYFILCYYSSSRGGIFTQTAPLTLNTDDQTIDFDF